MNFQECMTFIFQWEAALVENPHDPGGLTKYGISQKAYPTLDIKNLTVNQALSIYLKDYWLASKAELLNEKLRLPYFDCVVNQGQGRAIKLLQQALKVQVDGKIGQETILASHKLDPRLVVIDFLGLRALHYASANGFPRFGKGWMRRLIDCAIHSGINLKQGDS